MLIHVPKVLTPEQVAECRRLLESAEWIDGKATVSSIDALPEGVDCAVLAIPQAGVLAAIEACARRKVGGAVIFSAGFAEGGAEGRAAQERIGPTDQHAIWQAGFQPLSSPIPACVFRAVSGPCAALPPIAPIPSGSHPQNRLEREPDDRVHREEEDGEERRHDHHHHRGQPRLPPRRPHDLGGLGADLLNELQRVGAGHRHSLLSDGCT